MTFQVFPSCYLLTIKLKGRRPRCDLLVKQTFMFVPISKLLNKKTNLSFPIRFSRVQTTAVLTCSLLSSLLSPCHIPEVPEGMCTFV